MILTRACASPECSELFYLHRSVLCLRAFVGGLKTEKKGRALREAHEEDNYLSKTTLLALISGSSLTDSVFHLSHREWTAILFVQFLPKIAL